MWRIALILFPILLFSCKSSNTDNSTIETNDNIQLLVEGGTDVDLGEVNAGEVIAKRVYFTAKGNGELVLKDVTSTCGCTVAEWSKKAIKEGEQGYFEIQFDSYGYQGLQNKNVVLQSNAMNKSVIVNFYVNVK
jgi:hypothetical protein